MMSSYHYNYYYCYDYYDYPSYCCCSVLLNVFFSFFGWSVAPWNIFDLQCSSERLFKWKNKTKQNNPSLGYLHLSSDPHLSTSSTETSVFFDRGFHKRGSVTWTWCSLRPTWPFIMTVFSPVHGLCTLLIRSLLVYLPLSPHSVIVCSPNGILVSCIFTDVVDNSYSDS